MILKMFSVFDKAVGAYMQPFFAPSVGAAIRMFSDAVADKDSNLGRHPGDYTLFHVGDFDDSSGLTSSLDPHRLLGATEVNKPE